ncbi:UDP-2,4-diacetamido-2,4,6-trideoxy-beta-L-altropyranose hydrolase [Aureispira anguillae]|uniref:UDP-2,4-diacetamido-2,4, 6-trideoxy-beta-L-altropyranose hydrolase n=1 Tax=Aureispira anguillae TaxID=2864201 RepID=A0A915YK27_9BACT|nr:UDP-2,4-diacetamido-2,4,6-trideoxy-beta-L-altropyranose hydrolase [Aureispira anguillae]BDS14371.1 UDP-2,4-diacetamido-2,4, 6-trideoxy-beta-L-altropyranose hydrolase [Aureispira anguillae]
MINKKLFIRADGNSEIGYGHIIRCLALAEMLSRHFECIFVTRFDHSFLSEKIKQVCKQYILIEEENHRTTFFNLLGASDFVLLDNYFFTSEDQQTIKNKGCKLICIDDLHDKHYYADLVINHSIGISPDRFSTEKYTQLALGFEYALLRGAFRKPINYQTKGNHVFISFGGGDTTDFITRIMTTLLEQKSSFDKIHWVLGASNRVDSFSSNWFKNERIVIHEKLDAQEMVRVMDCCSYAIVPASSILIECLSRKIKVITGYYVPNQEKLYKNLVDCDFVVGLGDLSKGAELKEQLIQKMNLILDWESACHIDFTKVDERILNLFLNL